MDKHFLEFWGNVLLSAAESQKQFEKLAKWMNQGFSGFEDLNTMFRSFYGLDEGSPDFAKAWNEAEESFRKSLKDYLGFLGVVPKEEYLALVKKYEELKKKVATQEETIEHLRQLLQETGAGRDRVVGDFQELVSQQSEQFNELVKNFAEFFKSKQDDE
jgi:hypothetical protein